MILVDSSVWIAFLSPRASEVDSMVESLIRPANRVLITGFIFQEVLQGIKNEKSFHLIKTLIKRLPLLMPDEETHLRAAQLFRSMKTRGVNCATADVLIAALAIQYGVGLFTLDHDFQAIAKHSGLQLFH